MATAASTMTRPLSRMTAGAPCAISISAAVIVAAGLFAAGCQKPLFPESADRTQYDQYDRLRGQYVPPTTTDYYGREKPMLRERLLER